ncbi:FAD binding domain-containing protein [Dyadobacter pollutisoli]|uniref:Xanthine dehydrogenase family protein subunit M n=1 Tax=Dyadobacter pollutisoli TaxID=2910158 RepID=A0A9E8SSG2_9BACT|nr:xanthine dehydrogenase family protein subunit M [Dyadobacter pollutisoli]WAC15317.1 xanthine dehydrogenase family protein subunit M [Dyadobacter pollutisoli]
MNNFSYTQAKNRDDAIALSGMGPGSQFIAGGTNLIDLMKYNITRPNALVDINAIEDFHAIRESANGGLSLGALVTNAATAYHPLVEQRYPLLSRAILAGASAQIRNMATNGGNLLQRTRCYYFYDTNTPCNKREPGSGCPAIEGYNRTMAIMGTSEHCIAVFPSDMSVALAALNASVQVSGPEGSRNIPFSDFHRLPGNTPHIDNCMSRNELITSIELPANGFSNHYSYLKIRDRNSYAFALVSVATGLELEEGVIKNARIALGGVAHKPWRVKEAEDFLQNKEPAAENFWYAAEMILKGAKTFQFNAFKVELAKRAIVRNCIMALNPECQLPGAQASA